MTRLLTALLLALAPATAVAQTFDVSPGFRIDAAPAAKAAPKGCDCGPACACPAGDCPAACGSKAADPFWFALRVHVDHGNGTGAGGSGTPVWTDGKTTLVLTNAHVVPRADAGRPISVVASGKKYAARYVDGSEVSQTGPAMIHVHGPDLCLLEVAADLGAVTVAADAPAAGEPVGQWGYGGTQFGQGPVARHGVVMADPGYTDPTLRTSVRSVSGDSGAGVFNARAELIGVTWGGDGVTHRAVPLATVKAWLTRPRLRAMFPRLADRLDARREAREAREAAAEAPKGQPAEPVSPDALDVPAVMPPQLWSLPGHPPMTEAQMRSRFPGVRFPHDPPAACPSGRCPNAR